MGPRGNRASQPRGTKPGWAGRNRADPNTWRPASVCFWDVRKEQGQKVPTDHRGQRKHAAG